MIEKTGEDSTQDSQHTRQESTRWQDNKRWRQEQNDSRYKYYD